MGNGTRALSVGAGAALLVLACGTPTNPTDGGRDGTTGDAAMLAPGECRSAADCDDRVTCTRETCENTGSSVGRCRSTPDASGCSAGMTCDPRTGCIMGRACAADVDCRDMDACTTNERCDPAARVCTFSVLDGDMDGHFPRSCGGDDCDDSMAGVFPGAREMCNMRDDNCDGRVDDGIDLQTDPANCGGCGMTCGIGGACAGGRCAGCLPGLVQCSDRCADLQTEFFHCGRCENRCPEYSACQAGRCVCMNPMHMNCGSVCTTVSDNRDHCGRCGNACSRTLGADCIEGQCRCGTFYLNGASYTGLQCPDGSGMPACVDGRLGVENCGACGRRCAAGDSCVDGTCMRCGNASQPCCPDTRGSFNDGCNAPMMGTVVCAGGTCRTCGEIGQPCCGGGGRAFCTTGSCMSGTCR